MCSGDHTCFARHAGLHAVEPLDCYGNVAADAEDPGRALQPVAEATLSSSDRGAAESGENSDLTSVSTG